MERPPIRTTAAALPQNGRPDPLRPPRSRQAGPPQDHAVYNCQCGYVFEADVSTSVGCPHCGIMQAW
jgi:hypothetical protein